MNVRDADDSVFNYHNTASSRAGIDVITDKLRHHRIAIVGVGGTGAYILDLVAKTPVAEIHLFDDDTFANHNAFRSPGAPSLEELRAQPKKVTYFRDRYTKMHRGIVPHDLAIMADTVEQLRGMDFIFLCLDRGQEKRLIIERLHGWGISFIDVGMGVNHIDDRLSGILRVTASTPAQRGHVWKRIPLSDGGIDNEYARNIQIADLNALNAALAVVKWKKLLGFYEDFDQEHCSTYTINGNWIANEDCPCNKT